MLAVARIKLARWDEAVDDDRAVIQAVVTKRYSGDVEAEATLLLFFRPDGPADFVGLERIVGRIGGKHGEFFLHHVGTFRNGGLSTVHVVDGSGSGELRGLTGHGSVAGGREPSLLSLEYRFENSRSALRRGIKPAAASVCF